MIEAVEGHSVIFGDTGFRAKEGDPPNLKICRRGERNERMLVETVFINALCGVPHEGDAASVQRLIPNPPRLDGRGVQRAGRGQGRAASPRCPSPRSIYNPKTSTKG